MEHGVHRALVPVEPGDELRLVDVIGNVAAGEVPHLVRLLQVVHGDDDRDAVPVERLDDFRADEAGRAGDALVHQPFPKNSRKLAPALPSLPTAMPRARLAMRTA